MRPSPAKIWRRRLLAFAAVVVVLVAIFLFWIRESSFFSVDKVEISGVTVNQPAVIAALQGEAGKMTTLHVRDQALRDAVAGFPTVGALKVDANPPHELKIQVIERTPVADGTLNGDRVPISADGYVLRGMPISSKLIPMELSSKITGPRLIGPDLDQAELLGALPDQLRSGVKDSREDTEAGGVVVDLRNGIELRMGDGTEAAAKWASAAAVLAKPDLGHPAYIDVSVPTRPVAGGGQT